MDGFLRLRGVCAIRDVTIKGYSRISNDAIRFRIKTAKGDILHKNAVKKDIEEIYAMGYFEKCDAILEDSAVVFVVKEYPVIIKIETKGNSEINEKDILDAIGLKKFDILNTRILKTSIDRIKGMYRERGYYQVDVKSETTPTEGGIDLVFDITENKQLYIEEITFDGNENIPSSKLTGSLWRFSSGVIETSTRWPLGIFSHEGTYVDNVLDADLLRIEQFYGDNGYIQAKVGRPKIDIREDDGIYITIPSRKAPVLPGHDRCVGRSHQAQRRAAVDHRPQGRRRHEQGQDPGEHRAPAGHLHGQGLCLCPDQDRNRRGRRNHDRVNLRITQGKPVTIDSIQIKGNTKTRDKVIRRELEVEEGKQFSSSAIKDSKSNLGRLGYFSNTNIDPVPKSEDTMSLLVDVEETTTGSFSFGVAYSTERRPHGHHGAERDQPPGPRAQEQGEH